MSGGVEYVGTTEAEVWTVPSLTQPEPRIVLCLPLPQGRSLWVCSCPAKLNPEYNHTCRHIRLAEKERAIHVV